MGKYKPAVPKSILFILAGLLWSVAGIILCQYALRWLMAVTWEQEAAFGIVGLVFAFIIYQAGFKAIVKKNLSRLHALPERPCLFAFASWKSYLLIGVMIMMGILLRHSAVPKYYLAVPYEAMGSVLVIGSISYYRSWRR
ncbi:MAG: hypothetical protein PHP42_03070 [Bacteroidota bacterium]|nr:hypothetical protein [Bacteroidota bacterium]